MRDFRWTVNANNYTQIDPKCKWPYLPMQKKKVNGDPQCMQPILWLFRTLENDGSGVYRANAPQPLPGHWVGYYIEVEFPSDTDSGSGFYKS